jgi:hypothetical protein
MSSLLRRAVTRHRSGPFAPCFEARGGKMIQYHGWEDPGIAAETSTT